MDNETKELIVKAEQSLKENVLAVPERCKMIVVDDDASLSFAEGMRKGLKELRKQIDNTFDPIIDSTNKAHKEAVAKKKEMEKPLVEGEEILRKLIRNYVEKQEALRREKERELREKARREDEERRLAMAVEAEQMGDTEMATQIMEAPLYTPPPVVKSTTPKIDKRILTKTWRWRIVDERLIPREYFKVDEIKVNGIVRRMQQDTRIPGIEVYPE